MCALLQHILTHNRNGPMQIHKLVITSLLLVLSSALYAQEALLGKWQDAAHPDKQIEIYEKPAGRYFGKSLDPKAKLVFKDLIWNKQKQAYVGTLINPDTNDELPIELKMKGPNTFEFGVRVLFLKKTFSFNRI